VSYEGTLTPLNRKPVLYALESEFDFTEGTLLAKNVKIASGKSSATSRARSRSYSPRTSQANLPIAPT
jgi:hypothetical protein